MNRSLLVVLLFISLPAFTQELNCTVNVNATQVQLSDKRIFQTLQTAIFEFMNNTRWTNDVFDQKERIECSMFINITERSSADEFRATIQVQSRRIVYNTNYNSVMLNMNDQDFVFKYLEYEPLLFQENANLSNLTSVLGFYAYMIIGLDYESFGEGSGEPYFQKALAIVNNNQNAVEPGWKSYENSKNRYWFVENMLNPRFKKLRDAYYKYHRLGMDNMTADVEIGRTAITECLESIKQVRKDQPTGYLLQLFFLAKSDELVNIYSGAFPDVKIKAVTLLSECDPSNTNKYLKIKQ